MCIRDRPSVWNWEKLAEAVKGQIHDNFNGKDSLDRLLVAVIEFCLPLRGRHWGWELSLIHIYLNVLGLILTTQEAVKQFGAAGGSIINISSVASTSAPPGGSVYSATKGAVDTVTKSLAKELGARKIRVNAINPGMIETEGLHSAGFVESDFRKQYEAQTPLGRIGQPQDIASAAVFLASPDAEWITGETLYITGGYR